MSAREDTRLRKGGGLGDPTSIGEGNECPRGHWAPKGGWIVRSHIDWRGEGVPARTLGSERGVDCELHIDWRGE